MGFLLVVSVAVALAVPAHAAGAEAAVLTGSGLDEPVDLLTHESGFELAAITGAWFNSWAEDVTPLLDEPPTDQLGPRFTLTWVMRGPPHLPPEERSVIQYVYPYAEGGAVLQTPPGQGIWEGAVGWYVAPERFRALLISVGVGDLDDGQWMWPVIVAALVTLAIGLYIWRRRRQPAAM